jgi:hypothetical protein
MDSTFATAIARPSAVHDVLMQSSATLGVPPDAPDTRSDLRPESPVLIWDCRSSSGNLGMIHELASSVDAGAALMPAL